MNRTELGLLGLTLFVTCLMLVDPVNLPACLAAEENAGVSVEMVDGRTLQARVHPKTDHRRLWLTFSEPGILLTSSTRWDDVAQVTYKGNRYSAAEFQRISRTLEDHSEPTANVLEPPQPPVRPPAEFGAHPDDVSEKSSPRVRSLTILAWLENWDADLEPDGFVVNVVPLSKNRERVPVEAFLRLEVFGQHGPRGRTPRNPILLGRTSHRVRREDFADGNGAFYELPFSKLHPDFDVNVDAVGLVRAQLSVAGQGTFAASTMIFTRRFHPFRDMQQLQHGTRFLSNESPAWQRVDFHPFP